MEALCEICKLEIEAETTSFHCPYCLQPYHFPHIKLWLLQHKNCPVCKIQIDPKLLETIEIQNQSENRITELDNELDPFQEIREHRNNNSKTFFSKNFEPLLISRKETSLLIVQHDVNYIIKFLISMRWVLLIAFNLQLFFAGFWNILNLHPILGFLLIITGVLLTLSLPVINKKIFKHYIPMIYSSNHYYLLISPYLATNLRRYGVTTFNSRDIISLMRVKFSKNNIFYPGIEIKGDGLFLLADWSTKFDVLNLKLILDELNIYLETEIKDHEHRGRLPRLLTNRSHSPNAYNFDAEYAALFIFTIFSLLTLWFLYITQISWIQDLSIGGIYTLFFVILGQMYQINSERKKVYDDRS